MSSCSDLKQSLSAFSSVFSPASTEAGSSDFFFVLSDAAGHVCILTRLRQNGGASTEKPAAAAGHFTARLQVPFITPLFNQLAVTKLGPQPLLMLITSHLPSIWLLYCRCQHAELVSTTGSLNFSLEVKARTFASILHGYESLDAAK